VLTPVFVRSNDGLGRTTERSAGVSKFSEKVFRKQFQRFEQWKRSGMTIAKKNKFFVTFGLRLQPKERLIVEVMDDLIAMFGNFSQLSTNSFEIGGNCSLNQFPEEHAQRQA
jgi:hypothetical protein